MVIVVMGVAGAGKTTVGRRLAERLAWQFCDGDAFHTAEHIDRMHRGVPLTDEDRRTWLGELRAAIDGWVAHRLNVVLASSLLRRSYRASVLRGYEGQAKLVYLRADRALLERRLTSRTGHFAGAALLDSQLEILEEPTDALVLDAAEPPDRLVEHIRSAFGI